MVIPDFCDSLVVRVMNPISVSLASDSLSICPGTRGRLLSSSYAPLEDDPGYTAMIADLRSLFDRHQIHDRVSIDYDTRVYYGRLS